MTASVERDGRGIPTLAGAGGVVLWASETLLVTLTGDLPTLQIVALAFAVAALLSPLVWWVTGDNPFVACRQPVGVWLLSVLSLLGYHACLYYAVQKAPAVPAALLQGCTPLLIVVGSALLPGERVRWWHLVGTMAGLAGVVALVAGTGDHSAAPGADTGFYLAIVGAAAALWGVYSLLTRTLAQAPTSAMGMFYASAAIAAGVGHFLFERWVTPGTAEWAAIVALGLLPMGLALYLWDYGVKHGDLQALGALSYAEPLLAAILVLLFGRGEFGWSLLWAGVLIVGGAAVAARSVWDPKARADPAAALREPAPDGGEFLGPSIAGCEVPSNFVRVLARHAHELEPAISKASGADAEAAEPAAVVRDRWMSLLGADFTHIGRGPPHSTQECGLDPTVERAELGRNGKD